MIQTINFSQFLDSFSDTYKNNFSYAGKRALFDYLEELEESIGEPIELDTIALCCEYSEYESALDCIKDAGYDYEPDGDDEAEKEADALEWLENQTTVIQFEGGIIIAQF